MKRQGWGVFVMTRLLAVSLLLIMCTAVLLPSAEAHGLRIEYKARIVYDVQAVFDNGEPLKNGQVTVYAPDRPDTPWSRGMTDEQGRYPFVPDLSKEGEWTIRIRAAGHGAIVTIPVQAQGGSASGTTGYNSAQIALMIASVLWGAVGTMLYFKRRAK
jgi:nickel transport protein